MIVTVVVTIVTNLEGGEHLIFFDIYYLNISTMKLKKSNITNKLIIY